MQAVWCVSWSLSGRECHKHLSACPFVHAWGVRMRGPEGALFGEFADFVFDCCQRPGIVIVIFVFVSVQTGRRLYSLYNPNLTQIKT